MYNHILVPIDLDESNTNSKSVETALQFARLNSATVHFLHVVAPLGSFASTFFPEGFLHKLTTTAVAKLHEFTESIDTGDLQIHHIVAHGAIYDQILSMSDEVKADMIVMASHRPELSDYLLGPNAAKVVRHASATVVVVRD